jgi:hypothetical protein
MNAFLTYRENKVVIVDGPLTDREKEIVHRQRRLRDDMQMSPLEGLHWLPNAGSVMVNNASEDRPRFEQYVRKLIADGVPILTHTSVHEYQQSDDGHTAYPFWHVQGVPSKEGKLSAQAWMRSRGLDWNGDAKVLRAEVERALISGETVPSFGLFIRLAIFVKDPC